MKTAVEWLVEELNLEGYDYTIKQAKEMEKHKHGLLLNWVLKHYSTTTIDGMFGWVDAMGKSVTIEEILKHHYTETYNK